MDIDELKRREALLTATLKEMLRILSEAESDTESVVDIAGKNRFRWNDILRKARSLVKGR